MIPRGLYRDTAEPSGTRKREFAEYRDKEGRIDPFFDVDEDDEEWPQVNLGGFPTGLDLIGVCLRVVWKDKEILAYQAVSIFLCLDILFLFLVAIFPDTDQETLEQNLNGVVLLVKLFPFYIIASFIGTYFAAATVTVATIRMKGGNPGFTDGLTAATRKIPSILGWAIITAVVGVFLAIIRRKGRGARLAADLAQLAWGVATYFVIPVMLFEDEGPLSAIGRSTSIVKRTWKESLAGNFGMGAIFLGIVLLGLVVFYPIGSLVGGLTGGVMAVAIMLIIVLAFSSAANCVLVAALYRLARTGEMPAAMEGYHEFSGAFSTISGLGITEDAGLSAEQLTLKYAR